MLKSRTCTFGGEWSRAASAARVVSRRYGWCWFFRAIDHCAEDGRCLAPRSGLFLLEKVAEELRIPDVIEYVSVLLPDLIEEIIGSIALGRHLQKSWDKVPEELVRRFLNVDKSGGDLHRFLLCAPAVTLVQRHAPGHPV